MKKITLMLTFIFASISISAFAARGSKCILQLKYKVERDNNRQYFWCLDNLEESGDRFFYSTRRHVVRGVSKEECSEIAEDLIGIQSTLSFVTAPPLGMAVLVERDPYECDGTVVEVSKIKYKEAKH